MANPIQTLEDYLPGIPVNIKGTTIRPMMQAGEDTGAHMNMVLWDRPVYAFEVEVPALEEGEVDTFMGFANYHKCDRPFWFNGGDYGTVQNQVVCGYGNGTQKDFFAPNRYLDSPSVVAFIDGSPTTIEAVRPNSGMIRLMTAPAQNQEVTANYTCKFLCVFELKGAEICELSPRVLLGQTSEPTSSTKAIWQASFKLREIPQHWNF